MKASHENSTRNRLLLTQLLWKFSFYEIWSMHQRHFYIFPSIVVGWKIRENMLLVSIAEQRENMKNISNGTLISSFSVFFHPFSSLKATLYDSIMDWFATILNQIVRIKWSKVRAYCFRMARREQIYDLDIVLLPTKCIFSPKYRNVFSTFSFFIFL